jgi:hypothetical protein
MVEPVLINLALHFLYTDSYLHSFGDNSTDYLFGFPRVHQHFGAPRVHHQTCSNLAFPECINTLALPESITRLYKLANLTGNFLSDPIPTEIGSLRNNVEELWASDNGIDGTIPSEVGDLRAVTTLALNENKLRDPFQVNSGSYYLKNSIFTQNFSPKHFLPSSSMSPV